MAEDTQGESTARTTNRLLASLLIRDMALSEGAALLNRLSVPNADIAAIYDVGESSVRKAASRARRKTKE